MMLRGSLAALVSISAILAAAGAVAQPEGAAASDSKSGGAVEELPPIDLVELAKERTMAFYSNPIGQRVKRYLSAAGDKMAEGNLEEAKALLLKLNFPRLSRFERASVYRLLAYIDYQMAKETEALELFEKAIAEKALFLKADVAIMFNVVQLHAALQQWPEVISSLDRWRRFVPEPTGLSYYLRAVAYYQMDEMDLALSSVEAAVDLDVEPPESWLQLLAALYVQKEDYASVTPVLEELVMRFPKKQYWVQLSLIYGAQDDYRDSLAVQQIAYVQGLLSQDNELRRLARSYVFAGLPYRAATVLETGFQEGKIADDVGAYELLANSWIQAREFDRSLEPLTKAAKLSDDGNIYIRLGQVRMGREEWATAVALFKRAIEKGDLKNPGNADLLLGISLYNNDQVGPARFAFSRARKHEKTRKAATDWLAHIEKELQSG